MKPKLITTLDTSPMISLADCRLHLRISPIDESPDAHPDDDLVLAMLAAAREWVEGYTGLALTPRTLDLMLDTFPENEISLVVAPTVSVENVTYYSDGSPVVIDAANYVLDNYQQPGWLLPASGYTWPTPDDVVNAVTIRYAVGYSAWDDSPQSLPLPKALRAAVLLILGSLYENRENTSSVRVEEVPFGATALCDMWRVRKGFA